MKKAFWKRKRIDVFIHDGVNPNIAIQAFVIDKDYSFTFFNEKTGRYRLLTSSHGLIRLMLKLSYTFNYGYNSSNWGNFDNKNCEMPNFSAWNSLKEAGWDMNYLKDDLRDIYNDVTANAKFIDEHFYNHNDYVKAVL